MGRLVYPGLSRPPKRRSCGSGKKVPSAMQKADRAAHRAVCGAFAVGTAVTVVVRGTAIVAVILTEAAWTAIVTSATPTPAAKATLFARAEVLL